MNRVSQVNYKFRLETILKLRKQDENKASLALQKARSTFQSETYKLNALQDELDNIGIHHRTNAVLLQNDLLYRNLLKERIEVQADKVNHEHHKVNQAHQKLVEIQTKRKSLERLKEKGFEDYMANLAHKEQKELDEIATQRYNHNNNNFLV